jgi:hypothetical protein
MRSVLVRGGMHGSWCFHRLIPESGKARPQRRIDGFARPRRTRDWQVTVRRSSSFQSYLGMPCGAL